MILAKKLLLSDREKEISWRKTLVLKKKKPVLYLLLIHEEHAYPAEILSSKELFRADKTDPKYRVIGIAEDYGGALQLLKDAVEKALAGDPELKLLKSDLQEMTR